MDNKQILNDFGEFLVKEVYDSPLYVCDFYTNKNQVRHEGNKIFVDFFQSLSPEQLAQLKAISKDTMKSVLFQFLTFFNDSENYKLIYQENEEQIDLKAIVDYLPGLAIFENNWIERFSKHELPDNEL